MLQSFPGENHPFVSTGISPGNFNKVNTGILVDVRIYESYKFMTQVLEQMVTAECGISSFWKTICRLIRSLAKYLNDEYRT